MKIRLIFIILAVSAALMGAVVPASAATYGTEFPAYVNISGGAYIEIQSSNLGRCAFIFPLETQNNTFGFVGSGVDVCNISNATINGYVFLGNSTQYSARITRFGRLEYQTVTTPQTWVTVGVSSIYNTNVTFTDEIADRQTDNYFFDKYDIFFYALLVIVIVLLVVIMFLKLALRGDRW